jgi:hypothetical protein
MAIIYIHGVSVRSAKHGEALQRPFARWLGPEVAVDGKKPLYLPVFWGDAAAKFRWNLDSRPRTFLLRQGGDAGFDGLGSLREAGASSPLDRPQGQPGGAPGGPVLDDEGTDARPEAPPLSSVPVDRRADFVADLYLAVRPRSESGDERDDDLDPIAAAPEVAALADVAAAVAESWDELLESASTEDERAERLVAEVDALLSGDPDLIRQGGLRDWMSRAGEAVRRASVWPVDAVATVFAELRPVAHEFIARFVGDVLVYIKERETPQGPGTIPSRVLQALKAAHAHKKATGERIIVVTHSMGGQLLYDAVSYFAPRDPDLKDLRIDHWISCGAQVSLFAELGMFVAQGAAKKPAKLPLPAMVEAWTNYYDRNDLVGFIMEPVFDKVKDFEYNTGYGLAFAHTGFLARPSFFMTVASRIAE